MKYFVSYTQKDRVWAEWIAWQIEASTDAEGRQNEARLQAWDFAFGRNFVDAMNEASTWADVTVPILSPAFEQSEFTRAEWTTAFAKDPLGKKGSLLPVKVQNFDVEGLLGPIVYLDLVGRGEDSARSALIASLRQGRRKPDVEPGFPPTMKGFALALHEEPPFPGQDDLLKRYLGLVRQDHGRLLQLLGRDEESELLEKVYVSLALQPDQDRQRSRELESHPLGPMSLHQLLALNPEQHPRITRRWVVRGDPGSGKTTLLRHLASTLAGENEPAWIPMFFSLPRLVRDGGSPLDLIEKKLRRADMDEGVRPLFEALGRAGRLLVLLDGLDEVPEDKREDVEDLLLGIMQSWPETPIVVSSRPIGYSRPDAAFREVDVQPLEREQQVEFLARRLRDEDGEPDTVRAEHELGILEQHTSLDELAHNPLYLTLMSFLIRDGAVLTGSRSQLYEDIFGLLLKGRHRKRRPTEKIETIVKPQLVRQALQYLAYQMSHQNRDMASKDELEEHLERDKSLWRKLDRVRRWQDGQFLDDVAALTSILAPHDGEDEDWRYWHRTFREALAAEQLETLWRVDVAKVLEHARTISAAKREEQDKSRWAEAYAILAGRLAEPDALVLALLEQDRELGLRAFEGVRVLKEETLHQFFTNQDWEIRTAAYERLPDLITGPGRALELIDELRQRTRNGNDLFFLDLAARRSGERWPEAGPDAANLRARLYDHIPEPPVELFQWIDTPHNGRVELWREIPAGKGWIGAADGEEEYEDERPRHRVEILQPFAIAAVPVTQEQYAAFDPEHTSYTKGASHPLDSVTWYEAISFCRWLSTLPGFAGTRPRLPAEEEWEYACRAGTETRYWSGEGEDDLERVGWYGKNYDDGTHPVGEKPANPWGLYDVHGNVWEWTASPWDEKQYQGRENGIHAVDPAVPAADLAASPRARRVLRGGGFGNSALWCRSACRGIGDPGVEIGNRGFRVLLSSVPSRPSKIDH